MSEQLNLFNTCVLYVRISTTLDSQLTSLENQEFDLRRWATANNLVEVLSTIGKVSNQQSREQTKLAQPFSSQNYQD